MFGTSGIRGRVGEDVTADLALSVGRAIVSDGAERVVIGRDPRQSGAFLTDAVAAGARECGADVVRFGLASTPTIARGVAWCDADAGVSVTASHNPPTDNGFKLWTPSGQAFDEPRRAAITDRIESQSYDLGSWDDVGTETDRSAPDDVRERHIETIRGAVAETDDLSIVVDIGNGAGGLTADVLLAMGCSVETINAQPDGRFPGRPSEPTAEHCRSLCELVAGTDADLGIAHDGDADRMCAVTESGRFVSGDVLLALFARDAVTDGDRIAAPVDTSLVVDDVVAERGASVSRTRVGDVFVAERATEPDVVFGGEPSGAWIWPTETLCPDGHLAAAKLVELVHRGGSLDDLVDSIDAYPTRRANVPAEDKRTAMARIEDRILDTYDEVDTLDGVRVDLGDAWFLIRASGTQPLIRVTAEARDDDRAADVFETARTIVNDTGGS